MTTILTRTPKAPLNIRRMSFGERLRVKQQRNAVRSVVFLVQNAIVLWWPVGKIENL